MEQLAAEAPLACLACDAACALSCTVPCRCQGTQGGEGTSNRRSPVVMLRTASRSVRGTPRSRSITITLQGCEGGETMPWMG